MLSTPQRQLESMADAAGPHRAAHRDLVEHIVRALHETAEKKPPWKRVAWHCWLSVIAQTHSIWVTASWGPLGQDWGDPQQRKVLDGEL